MRTRNIYSISITLLLAITIVAQTPTSQTSGESERLRASMRADRQEAVLNRLRNEINLTYGFKDDSPRINLGPCGRFGKEFREQWNARFKQKINIVFAAQLPKLSELFR